MTMSTDKYRNDNLLKQHIQKTKKLVKPTQLLVTEGINYQTKERKYASGLINVIKIRITLNIETPLVGRICQYLYEVEQPAEMARLVEVKEMRGVESRTQWQWSPILEMWLQINDDVNGLYLN